MEEVKRKPLLTIGNTRNAKNHPEFLDVEMLFERFKPLVLSIYNHFCNYDGVFITKTEMDDLYGQIYLEFVQLVYAYDPKRGVDFPGFLKMNLSQRVQNYVNRYQRSVKNEYLVRSIEDQDESDRFENSLDLVDEDSIHAMEITEAKLCIPWHTLTETQKLYCNRVLKGVSLKELSQELEVPLKEVNQEFKKLIDILTEHNTTNNTYRR